MDVKVFTEDDLAVQKDRLDSTVLVCLKFFSKKELRLFKKMIQQNIRVPNVVCSKKEFKRLDSMDKWNHDSNEKVIADMMSDIYEQLVGIDYET